MSFLGQLPLFGGVPAEDVAAFADSVLVRHYRAGEDIADALARRFDPPPGVVGHEHREKFEVMNGVHSNAAGLHRWLETRDRPKKAD